MQQAHNGSGLTVNTPKTANNQILNDILNLTQISASNAQRASRPAEKQQHQIKKIKVSNTGGSRQPSAHREQEHSSTNYQPRGHSASRGNSGSHQLNPQIHQQRGSSGNNRESSRKAQ